VLLQNRGMCDAAGGQSPSGTCIRFSREHLSLTDAIATPEVAAHSAGIAAGGSLQVLGTQPLHQPKFGRKRDNCATIDHDRSYIRKGEPPPCGGMR